jgi:serine/threonine-protein kinase
LIGSQISHYRILRKLGEGGMGVVYEAYDLRLGRRVALKFPGAGSMAAEDVRERLLSEARAAAALNHPNICTVYEVDEADGQLFIAMEYCDGASLRELIRKGPLDPGVALAIVIQVAEGLTEAHNLQIVHRDIKSSNIMVDSRNHARLLDSKWGRATRAPTSGDWAWCSTRRSPAAFLSRAILGTWLILS